MSGVRPRIFISYRHDAEATAIVETLIVLLADDYEVLVDTSLRSGDRWYAQLERWMRACDAAIILVSRTYLTSEFCSYEAGVLMHRQRASASKPDWGRFLVFPYVFADV